MQGPTCPSDAPTSRADGEVDDAPRRFAATSVATGAGGPLFASPMIAGFECSDHRREDGRRLDLLASTAHDRWADADYARLRAVGIAACREGASWVRCEPAARAYDFSSLSHRVASARAHGVQVVWDLMHFGWPADIDIFAPAFPRRFGAYAGALARWLAGAADGPAVFTPINEISFLAWAGGDVRCMNPFASARGVELKAQLVLATIEAIEAIRAVIPGARFLQPEPIIQVVADPAAPRTWRRVECDNLLQYQAWDMLTGRVWPRLGGNPSYLDIVGVNFYPDNQFTPDGVTVGRDDPRYRPLSRQLLEVAERYGRPVVVSETGCEGDERGRWLRYVAGECVAALRADCDLHAVTWYPILNHPGWADDRHCHNGAWDYADEDGRRHGFEPLLEELRLQSLRLAVERAAMLDRRRGAVRLTA